MKYECPECGGTNLDVSVSVWARLLQNVSGECETDVTDGMIGDQEWGDESQMLCRDCGHCAIVATFISGKEAEDEEDNVESES